MTSLTAQIRDLAANRPMSAGTRAKLRQIAAGVEDMEVQRILKATFEEIKDVGKHSVECTFQHFLSYSGLRGKNEYDLRRAFYAGKDTKPPIEPVSQACTVCDSQGEEK